MTDLRRFSDLRCVVLGNYVADCVIKTATLPSWNSDLRAQSIAITPGGKAANQAVMLARMGAQVAAIGAVGDDAVGADVLGHLRSNRVNTRGIQVKPDVATPVCLILSGQRDQKSITWHIAEELEVSGWQIRDAETLIAHADVVCLTFELPFAMIDLALKTARGCGTKVVLNAAPSRSAVELTDLCFTGVTSLIVNELEARSLFGPSATPEDETARISAFTQRHGIELVCVTRGARGCSYWYAQQLDHQPGFPITARNTAGAGDAFAATLALYRACGYQPAAAIRSACAAGALAAESPGTLSSMPTDQQLHRRLAEWSEVEPAAAVRPIPDQSSESPGQLVTHE